MSSSQTPRILRIPRSDDQDAYVLVHVSRSGSAALDLKLAATEGENPYVGSVKQSRLKDLRAKSYQGSDDDWVHLLSYVFGQPSPSPSSSVGDPDWASGIEVLASIRDSGDEDKELVVTIRKRVESITQRLGFITLKQDDEQSIELFDWSGVAVARANALEQQNSLLDNRCRMAEDSIQKLNTQLEELVHAKVQHESQLTTSFVQLLNEKKLKIRQQRFLASATVDPIKVSEKQSRESGRDHRPAGNGQSAKRKVPQPSDDDSDSNHGFERMEVDQTKGDGLPAQDQETDDLQRSTPQPLEEEDNITTTDDDFDQLSVEQGGEEKDTQGPATKLPVEHPILRQPPPPPPKRELPFAQRIRQKSKAHQTEEKPENDTAGETDDEL